MSLIGTLVFGTACLVTTSFFNYSPYMAETSAPTSPWAETPIALVATPQHLTGKTDLFTAGATHMALVHNAMIRGFNSIYQQAPHVAAAAAAAAADGEPALARDFARYALTWVSFVTSHHHDEEDNLFAQVSAVLDDDAVWAGTRGEHDAFIGGVARLRTYLEGTLAASGGGRGRGPSAGELLRIMDSFRAPLEDHLHSEVRTIAALAAHPRAPRAGTDEAAAAAAVFKAWGRRTVMRAGVLDVVPFFLLNLDRTFEDGRWARWPPMPAPVRWALANVVGTYHGNWWRFASCGSDGTPRELFAHELLAKKSSKVGAEQGQAKSATTSAGENPTARADEL